jgi:hypothetical protein
MLQLFDLQTDCLHYLTVSRKVAPDQCIKFWRRQNEWLRAGSASKWRNFGAQTDPIVLVSRQRHELTARTLLTLVSDHTARRFPLLFDDENGLYGLPELDRIALAALCAFNDLLSDDFPLKVMSAGQQLAVVADGFEGIRHRLDQRRIERMFFEQAVQRHLPSLGNRTSIFSIAHPTQIKLRLIQCIIRPLWRR